MMNTRAVIRTSRALLALVGLVLLVSPGCVASRHFQPGLFDTADESPPIVRVRLTDPPDTMVVTCDGRMLLRVMSASSPKPTLYSTQKRMTILRSDTNLIVRDRDNVTLADRATGLMFEPTDSSALLHLNGTPYEGVFVTGFQDTDLVLVNRLNLEQYLTGVLTPELGERTADEFEAVKAQAVAARTYALAHLGQYDNEPYDLKADVSDQVYVGRSQQRDWVDRAVTQTNGEVLRYDGHLIDAFYHSTCGGRTDAVEDVWEGAPRPYLTSVDDDTFCVWSKYTEWTETFDRQTLYENLRTYRKHLGRAPIGEFAAINDIELVSATPGGRLITMTVKTSSGDWTICGDQIRWALGRPSRPGSILPSSRFTMDMKQDSTGHIIGAIVRGRGYGHGIGMCQCGMIGRARAGQDYRQILTHYYPGARIVSLN